MAGYSLLYFVFFRILPSHQNTITMSKRYTLLIFLALGYFSSLAQVVLPSPEKCVTEAGEYSLKPEVRYRLDVPEAAWTTYFRETLLAEAGSSCRTVSKGKADFRFLRDTSLGAEAYTLHIDRKGITITAGNEPGFFYALQTLRQCMQKDARGKASWPYLHLEDRPRYRWRSFMLDSGRQYQEIATVKKYIDMAAALKMNYFHWHLTEGLGWRIEIRKYPRLTQVGAFVGTGPEQKGFYSQNEIRDIVRYAADRYITVVPEIDMPGHSEAALTAYPGMSCFGEIPQIPREGFTDNIFCAGKPATLRFLQDILDEVCELFPSPYIHLGGDEALKGNWNKCPDCQARIKQEGLANSHELQVWFSQQMATYLKQKGRKVIFWDDIIDGSNVTLPDNIVVHWWNWRSRKETPFTETIKRGHEIICGTNYYTYLNFPLTPWKGYGSDRTFDLQDAYENNPSRNRDTCPQVLGMSCALWTDYELTEDLLDQRLFPRILVLAEQMWHRGTVLSFSTFREHIQQKQPWFEQLGYQFGPGLKSEIPK